MPNLSLAEIALCCGFAEQSHFTRIQACDGPWALA